MGRYSGIARSLFLYYGVPFRTARLRRFSAEFVSAGRLCFDIGALGTREGDATLMVSDGTPTVST